MLAFILPSSSLLSASVLLSPSAAVPSPRLPATARRVTTVRLSLSHERIESVKACAIAACSGTVASAPIKLSMLSASKLWGVSSGVLAVQLALFGVVYRCAVRCDDSSALRQGAVAAAALCRALSTLPLSMKDMMKDETLLQFLAHFGENAIAFGFAARACVSRSRSLFDLPPPCVASLFVCQNLRCVDGNDGHLSAQA